MHYTKLTTPIALAVGVYIGFYLGKRKFQALADEEVASVTRYFREKYSKYDAKLAKKPSVEIIKKEKKETFGKTALMESTDMKKYKDYSKPYQSPSSDTRIPGDPVGSMEKEERYNSEGPYIITPEEFGESTYEAHTLFFYADKVLADDDYNIVDDVNGLIGDDSLSIFDDPSFEYDCIYVRNDILGIDYEVLIDERQYAKVSNKSVPGLNTSE